MMINLHNPRTSIWDKSFKEETKFAPGSRKIFWLMEICSFTLLYFILAKFGFELGAVGKVAMLVWAPTGVSLALLLIFGQHLWPGIALGAFVFNWYIGAPVLAALVTATGNTLEAVVAVYFLQRLGFQNSLNRLRDVFLFVMIAPFLCTVISATFGTFSLYFSGFLSKDIVPTTWFAWWMGDLMSNLIITPFLLSCSTINGSIRSAKPSQIVEVTAIMAAVVLATATIFTDWFVTEGADIPRPYFIFPFMILVALRLGPIGSAASVFIVSSVAIGTTFTEHGRFWAGSLILGLIEAEIFAGILSLSNMVLSAAVSEKTREQIRLRESNAKREAMETEKKVTSESLKFLADANLILSESIDYKTTLKHVSHAAVPGFGDWCFVQILGPNGKIESVELACADCEKEDMVRAAIPKYLFDPSLPTTTGSVIRENKSCLISDFSTKIYRELGADQELIDLVEKLGVVSMMSCPIQIRGEMMGVFTLVSTTPGRKYGERDFLVFEELARMTAVAIVNARLYRETKEALYARDEFLSITSHELKTPLTTMNLLIQMTSRVFKKSLAAPPHPENPGMIVVPARTAKSIEEMEAQTKRLSILLDELLDLTRIRTGTLHLNRAEVDLSELVKRVVESFKIEASLKQIAITTRVEPLVIGVWDGVRIEQVVSNLISNAMKYGGTKPFSVTVEKIDDQIARFTVQDQGMGIRPDMLGKIFERFERLDVSGKEISGLGLGLYISRQIVEAHGGRIHVQSEVGRGSIFTVELPLRNLEEKNE